MQNNSFLKKQIENQRISHTKFAEQRRGSKFWNKSSTKRVFLLGVRDGEARKGAVFIEEPDSLWADERVKNMVLQCTRRNVCFYANFVGWRFLVTVLLCFTSSSVKKGSVLTHWLFFSVWWIGSVLTNRTIKLKI